jgi:signal peptidase I
MDRTTPDAPPDTTGGSPEDQTPKTKHQTPVRHTPPVRVLLITVVVFLGLFLVLRTIAVEPFGVPTGSMTPALVGHHRAGPCPRCGYDVRVGRLTSGNLDRHFARVACQNCEFGREDGQLFSLADARDLSGDRVLVDKNVYSLRRPRRWEMAVFRCPDTDPKEFGKPYVKRLIGLPGETVFIDDGDVYINGAIARKGLAEIRETLFPVFDMTCSPKVRGWNERWIVSTGPDPRLPAGTPNVMPANGTPVIENDALVLDASEAPQAMTAVTYRHYHLDKPRDEAEQPVYVWNAYDGRPGNRERFPVAHDFILTCDIEVGATTTAEASFAARLLDGADAVTAEISVGPKKTGQAQLTREGHGGLQSVTGVALEAGRTYRLEFAFVDRTAHFALDGRSILPPAELPQVTKRNGVPRPLQLGARGCRVILRNLRLHRDIHYTRFGEHGTERPVTMAAGEYFMLGDNSGNSQDSRKWPSPGVPEVDFIGKPFLVHQPLRPGKATVGGQPRDFQTLDWARLRWLH